MIYNCFFDFIQKDVKHFEELTVSQFGFKRRGPAWKNVDY